ncbi:polyprenyl synthetase family protein [Streptomyces sp. NPDC044571]|uniref:polyprenyl synthetase family protein n=1 Tax=Streptomyces sp. NPDC044571 TaxID=3155371 RepID=UPI0034092C0E
MHADTVHRPVNTAELGHRSTSAVAALVMPALRETVDTIDNRLRPIVAYHFGWMDTAGRPVAKSSGKMVRAALAVLSAQAVGGDPEQAVVGAVAVELVHNFSLLHDDVMDRDLERRGRPTVWSKFGIPAAILAGDILLARACGMFEGRDGDQGWATKTLIDAIAELAEGQMADLSLERRSSSTLREALTVSEQKTAALLRCACELGAGLAGATAEQRERLGSFGTHLGMSFQLVDDVLGIWGDPAVTGKPVRSDLHNRKKSIPVVAALNSGTEASRELAALYAAPEPLTEEQARRAAELVELAGGRAWTEAEIERHRSLAVAELAAAGLTEEQQAPLLALADYIAFRNH